MNRRRFIHSLFRTGILGAFAAMTGIFAYKGKISHESKCNSDFQCKACGKLKNCRLPESDNFKKNE